MNTKTYPQVLVEEIQQRLDQLRTYIDARAVPTGLASAPTAGVRTDDAIRRCITLLMDINVTDARGRERPLFCKAAHWQAVYRILVDFHLGASDGDFRGFQSWVPSIMPQDCRVPFSYEALRGISKTPFVRPFLRWHFDSTYFRTRSPYDSMHRVAQTFLRLLEENGLVKR